MFCFQRFQIPLVPPPSPAHREALAAPSCHRAPWKSCWIWELLGFKSRSEAPTIQPVCNQQAVPSSGVSLFIWALPRVQFYTLPRWPGNPAEILNVHVGACFLLQPPTDWLATRPAAPLMRSTHLSIQLKVSTTRTCEGGQRRVSWGDKVAGCTVIMLGHSGVPQGSVLGPSRLIMYIR